MFNNKGLVSITTFSLLILLFIVILSLSYFFYNNSRSDFDLQINNKEILESLHKLRAELLILPNEVNATLNYTDKYAKEFLQVKLKGTNMTGEILLDKFLATKTLTLYGLEFCSNKNISLFVENLFLYNGTCIVVS